MEIILTYGLPASGKSTWARSFVEDSERRDSWVRVSKDDIRRSLGIYWIKEREEYVRQVERQMILRALIIGYNVVVDATNFGDKRVDFIKSIIDAAVSISNNEISVELSHMRFPTPLKECLKRDSMRSGSHKVGEKVIKSMYDEFIKV